jgi:CTP synthase
LFTNVPLEAVITAKDVDNVYEIPLIFAREGLDSIVLNELQLPLRRRRMTKWKKMLDRMKDPKDEVNIALIGKYAGLRDSYMSLNQALHHAGTAHQLKVNISWIEAEKLEAKQPEVVLKSFDGILVPGGFGVRGIEGKINSVNYARTKKVPFFGICLGMQCATIEYARDIASFDHANSTEFNTKTPHKIFFKWRELKGVQDLGGTMRLGSYLCRLEKGSVAEKAYGKSNVWERHRHRFEFNPEFEDPLRNAGLVISGKNPKHGLVEIVELKDHPWFLGCQFHPEFKSKPIKPHPLFKAFIGASYEYKTKRNKHKRKS